MHVYIQIAVNAIVVLFLLKYFNNILFFMCVVLRSRCLKILSENTPHVS